MTDVEAHSTQRPNNNVNNPYSGNSSMLQGTWHPVNVMYRCFYMGLSLYGMDYFETFQTIMHSPDVRHEWFKMGLALTVRKFYFGVWSFGSW
jgi:hypothetical protein